MADKKGRHRFTKINYIIDPTSSHDFHGKAIWDYVSAAGDGDKKVGIVNYPMLFPPYEINGFMISGVGSSENKDGILAQMWVVPQTKEYRSKRKFK